MHWFNLAGLIFISLFKVSYIIAINYIINVCINMRRYRDKILIFFLPSMDAHKLFNLMLCLIV